ncbi:outer membrane protein assembly factor [Maribacter sp. SA7]|uniref:outer membrane protein assembly factor n=1 Tax=Maribacter zhoushanensis TaxID=3030012 RepID=UPI0023EB295D|nr:outer membrane protein assembly factor [Maribacter zhoushanensis]MDF4203726.1 outer membrane protein assembly factor [Maribacter zhoushanensis]
MNTKTLPFLLLMLVSFIMKGQELTVAELHFSGAKQTKTSFIENLVDVQKGMMLDSVLINRDILRLKRLPSISHAYFNVTVLPNETCSLEYVIEENFTLIPFANLFSSSNDNFAFRVGLQEFNSFGRNITLGAFYQYDNYSSFGLSVRAPYLFSSKLGLAVNYNDFTTLEPVFFQDDTADYKYSNTGFELLGLYEFNFKNRMELGFSFFTEDYQYVEGATGAGVPLNLNVDKHLFKFIYDYNSLDYFYHYLEGFRSQLNLQYVGSTNANLPEFLIGFNDFTYFKRIGDRGNWANRLRLGLASNVDSPFAPFTVDNNLNIRGVGNTIDRGTGMIVLNTEYRQTFIDRNKFVLQGNIFVDGGTWRNPAGGFDDLWNSENIRIYPGVGLRFMHKRIFNAIFRIDYGYGITKDGDNGIVFGIGQYF